MSGRSPLGFRASGTIFVTSSLILTRASTPGPRRFALTLKPFSRHPREYVSNGYPRFKRLCVYTVGCSFFLRGGDCGVHQYCDPTTYGAVRVTILYIPGACGPYGVPSCHSSLSLLVPYAGQGRTTVWGWPLRLWLFLVQLTFYRFTFGGFGYYFWTLVGGLTIINSIPLLFVHRCVYLNWGRHRIVCTRVSGNAGRYQIRSTFVGNVELGFTSCVFAPFGDLGFHLNHVACFFGIQRRCQVNGNVNYFGSGTVLVVQYPRYGTQCFTLGCVSGRVT